MHIRCSRYRLLFLVTGLIAGLGVSGCSAIHPGSSRYRCVSAHRGDHSHSPDNSLPAIASAIDRHMTFVEIDVRRTVDGAFYLLHDRTLKPGNYLGPREFAGRTVDTLTAADLDLVSLPPDGDEVPRLEDALRLFTGSKSFAQFDIKFDDDDQIVEFAKFLLDHPALENTLTQCYTLNCAAAIRSILPNAKLLMRLSDINQLPAFLEVRPVILQVDRVTSEIAEAAHRAEALILVKSIGTLDSAETWEVQFASGANIILTDRPRELRPLLDCPWPPFTFDR